MIRLIFLAITIVGLIEYLMLDSRISFTTVFLCSFIAICVVYGDISFPLFVISSILSSITMVIIWIVAETINSYKNNKQ